MMRMIGGTLFSGIGAPELAAPEIDWRWCAETDPFASAVLAARFPHSKNLGDVTKVDWDAVEPVDIVVFGSPCQSFSVAGQRGGLDDPRGDMAFLGLRAVERIRPRWVVFENVPGLLSIDSGRAFGAFLGRLGQCGYGFAYRVLDAQYFGVPQRRRRVFVVGCLGGWGGAAAVLFERESLRWNPAPRRDAGEGVADPITRSFAKHGGASAGKDSVLRNAVYGGNNTAGPIEVATACRAKGGTGHGDFESETFVIRGKVDDAIPILEVGARTNGDGYRQTGAQGPVAVAFDTHLGGEVTCSIDASYAKGAGGRGAAERPVAVQHMSVRRLTPVECERLQGFPDDFTAIPYRGKPAADGPRYRALGNAMAVPVIGWILARVI